MDHEKQLNAERNQLLVSKDEAAHMLGVCRRTVDNLLRNCELASVRIGKRRLIPAAALDRFIRKNRVTAKPATEIAAAQ